MRCSACGARTEKSASTSVTELGNCLIIVQRLEEIIASARKLMQQVSIIDYAQVA